MSKNIVLALCISLSLFFYCCESGTAIKKSEEKHLDLSNTTDNPHLLDDIKAITDNGNINAVIEIPAGTLEKWELDKSTGQIKWEIKDGKPRVVNYIGYPGNYGMIPQTLLPKEKGGDGDPLDILVLGHPAERGQILKSKIIGVLYLMDDGEQDDKLIAVSSDSPMYDINSIEELSLKYKGVIEIVELWFTNYKGSGKMEAKGYGDHNVALEILQNAMIDYQSNRPIRNIE